jgi:hypothetical protein
VLLPGDPDLQQPGAGDEVGTFAQREADEAFAAERVGLPLSTRAPPVAGSVAGRRMTARKVASAPSGLPCITTWQPKLVPTLSGMRPVAWTSRFSTMLWRPEVDAASLSRLTCLLS